MDPESERPSPSRPPQVPLGDRIANAPTPYGPGVQTHRLPAPPSSPTQDDPRASDPGPPHVWTDRADPSTHFGVLLRRALPRPSPFSRHGPGFAAVVPSRLPGRRPTCDLVLWSPPNSCPEVSAGRPVSTALRQAEDPTDGGGRPGRHFATTESPVPVPGPHPQWHPGGGPPRDGLGHLWGGPCGLRTRVSARTSHPTRTQPRASCAKPVLSPRD